MQEATISIVKVTVRGESETRPVTMRRESVVYWLLTDHLGSTSPFGSSPAFRWCPAGSFFLPTVTLAAKPP
jgi:hypothetical protein